jgi:hypothetical protein
LTSIFTRMAFATKFWTVQQHQHMLSTTYNNRHYLIGFGDQQMAQQVAYRATQKPGAVHMTRRMHEDIALDVKKSMLQMEMPTYQVADSITVDTDAKLYIPKSHDVVYDDARLRMYDNHDFFMFPFEKYIGIVMPYELYEENSESWIFTCNVIDPSFNIDLLRKGLDL